MFFKQRFKRKYFRTQTETDFLVKEHGGKVSLYGRAEFQEIDN